MKYMTEGCQQLLKVWPFLKTNLLVLILHLFPHAVKRSVAMKDRSTGGLPEVAVTLDWCKRDGWLPSVLNKPSISLINLCPCLN